MLFYLCSFQSTYTSWHPNPDGKQFLCNLQRFKEKQIRKYTFQAMEDSQLRSSIGQSGGSIFHRLLSRDIFPGNGIIYNFCPLGLLDTDQRAYPYILDWYYTCHSELLGRDVDSSTHRDEPGEDIWQPLTVSKPLTEIEGEEIWDSNLYERARSHLEASTSSAFFQRATFKCQGREQNSTSCPWWAQASVRRTDPRDSYVEPLHSSFIEPPDFANHYTSGHCSSQHSDWALNIAHPTGPEDSFHEPPNFGNHYVSGYHSSYHSSDVSEGTKELDHIDYRATSSWTSPQALSKTRYMDDDPDLEQGLSFHFADVPQNDDGDKEGDGHGVAGICSSRPASLHVRMLPRSSDPV